MELYLVLGLEFVNEDMIFLLYLFVRYILKGGTWVLIRPLAYRGTNYFFVIFYINPSVLFKIFTLILKSNIVMINI